MKDLFVIDGYPVLFYKDKKYYHTKLGKYIPIYTVQKTAIFGEYIMTDYIIEKEKEMPTEWSQLGWACKIISPDSENYWRDYTFTFGLFEITTHFEKKRTYSFLSTEAEIKKNILTIKYNVQDAIFITIWLLDLWARFERRGGSIISFNGEVAETTNPISFFEKIISNNEIKVEARFDQWCFAIDFNDKLPFSSDEENDKTI